MLDDNGIPFTPMILPHEQRALETRGAKECWVNLYLGYEGGVNAGGPRPTRDAAVQAAVMMAAKPPFARVHVTPKKPQPKPQPIEANR